MTEFTRASAVGAGAEPEVVAGRIDEKTEAALDQARRSLDAGHGIDGDAFLRELDDWVTEDAGATA